MSDFFKEQRDSRSAHLHKQLPHDLKSEWQNSSDSTDVLRSDGSASCHASISAVEDVTQPKTLLCDVKKNPERDDFKNIFYSTKTDELFSQDWQANQCHTVDELDKAVFAKSGSDSKSFLTYRDTPRYATDENMKMGRKSKSNSSSWFEHILTKRQINNPLRTKSSNIREENDPSSCAQDLSSSSKKETPPSLTTVASVHQAPVKTKIRSVWNNMKYGWKMKREVTLKVDSAVWLLGQCYHNKLTDNAILSQDVSKQLKLDLLSKIWLTYRTNFPAIPGTDLMSDTGWGCMLRCGQMMMAQALVCHFLYRDWRLSSDLSSEKRQIYKRILRWFGDSLSDQSPFSLHHLVSLGENYGRKAGDWYGPTHAAHVLRDALVEAKADHPSLRNLCMYVASDGIVFKQDVIDLCMGSENNQSAPDHASSKANENAATSDVENSAYLSCKNTDDYMSFENPCPSYSEFGPPSYSTLEPEWKSLILFVSVRLGNDKINPYYIPCLKSLLAYEHCIGIIGGRPKHALYFIGWQDDKLIHMDPHSCQPAIDVEKEDFSEKSFHSSSIRTVSFTEMDPSCAIGFYFRQKEDFQGFVERFLELTSPVKRNLDYPVFALAEGKRAEIEEINALHDHEGCALAHSSNDDDDYILL